MRHLVVLLLLIGAGHAMAQPVTITFTGGSEFRTEMDSLTAEYVITLHGPYHYRKIKMMAFPGTLPDSASIQRLQSKDIAVYYRTNLIAPIVLSPTSKKPGVRTSDYFNAVTSTSRHEGPEVTITFQIGSELKTQMDSLSDQYVITMDGPYSCSKIKKMNFLAALPDTASITQLQSRDIQIYLQGKLVAPIMSEPIVQKSMAVLPDTAKTAATPPTSYPDRYPTSRSSAPGTVPQINPELLYTATVGTAIGIGLDYGGIGMKITFNPTDAVSFFGGLGYNFAGLGFNGGLELNFAQHTKVSGFLSAMYGYNAVLLDPNNSLNPSEIFYGPSFGLGVRSWSFNGDNFFSFQVIYPVRDEIFMNAATTEKPWPVLFGIGFGFGK